MSDEKFIAPKIEDDQVEAHGLEAEGADEEAGPLNYTGCGTCN